MSTHSPADRPVQDHLAGLDGVRAERVARVYRLARALAPDAVEGVKYAMPALVVGGLGLVSARSTRHHVGIYPYSGSVVGQFADELAALGVPTTKGAIQWGDGVDLPDELLARVVAARLTELGR